MKYLKFIFILLAVAVALLGFYYFGFSKKPVMISALEPQFSEIGGVSFTAVPKDFSPGNQVNFKITIDTHAGSLDFELIKISILEDGKGNQYRPIEWRGPAIEGHHVSGILIFPKLENKTDTMKLIIQDASPRIFEWQL